MKISDFGKLTLRLLGHVTRTEHLLMQEYKISSKSKLMGHTKINVVRDTGVVVVGIKSSKQKRYRINVGFNEKLKTGSLLLMGTGKQLSEFEKLATKKSKK